jgi:hypothetical protein
MTTITINTIKSAAAALHKAENAIDTSNAGRTAAVKTLYLATAGFFFANPHLATGDGVAPLLPIIHGPKWTTYNPTVQKSRKTELLTIATVAKVKGRVADCIAAAEATEKDFKSSFLKAVTFAKNNATADADAIKAAVTEKKKAPAKTAGDHMENVVAGLIALATDHRAVYAIAGFKDAAVTLQTIFNAERATGGFRFAREMAKPKSKAAPVNLADV